MDESDNLLYSMESILSNKHVNFDMRDMTRDPRIVPGIIRGPD